MIRSARPTSEDACYTASARRYEDIEQAPVHGSHSGVSLALDIFISPGFLKCRVTNLIAGDLWGTFIVDGCNDHPYFLQIYVLE